VEGEFRRDTAHRHEARPLRLDLLDQRREFFLARRTEQFQFYLEIVSCEGL
jgi:hypothetical protein